MVKVIERNWKKTKKDGKTWVRLKQTQQKRNGLTADEGKRKTLRTILWEKSNIRAVNSFTKSQKLISWLYVAFYFYSFIHWSYGVGFHQSVIIISLIGCDVFFLLWCVFIFAIRAPRNFFSSLSHFVLMKNCCSTVIVSHFDRRFADEMKR